MPNSLLTPQIFAKLTLMHLGGALNVCRNMSKEVTKEFGRPKDAKPGDTVSVRKPYRFTVSKGLEYDPQGVVDTAVPIKVNQVAQIGFQWDSVERTLSLREASELYAKPAALALASTINAEAAQYIAQNTFNCVGTYGTAPADEQPYLLAGDKIVQLGLPENEELSCIINRKMSSAFVHGVKVLYNPAGSIGKQWDQGEISERTLGYRFFRDQTIYTHTNATFGGTPLVNGANQVAEGGNNGTMTINTDGWTSGGTTLTAGTTFTLGSATDAVVGGIHSVHPQTKQSTGDLLQFVVLQTISDTTGAISAVVAPALTPSGPYANADGNVVDNAIITVTGASGVSSPQGLLLHKNAFAFVSVPLANPEKSGVEMVAEQTDPETGLSLSFIRAFDAKTRMHINRFDCLYDFGTLYREMCCRIAS